MLLNFIKSLLSRCRFCIPPKSTTKYYEYDIDTESETSTEYDKL
jgi:hypothetical protein